MGQGTLVSEIGDGLYTVDINEGSDVLATKLARLSARLGGLVAINADLLAARSIAQSASDVLRSDVNDAIDAYEAEKIAGGDAGEELEAVNEANKLFLQSVNNLAKQDALLRRHEAEHANVTSRIAYLTGFDLETTRELWCADYTQGAAGLVGTLEIPGEPALVVIAPGAIAPNQDHGAVVARPAMDSKQLFHSLALLPGWQKFKPIYRIAVIDAINPVDETCDITLDAAISSAQDLDINRFTTRSDVPVEYMDCNTNAFEVGDRVIVLFIGQNWDNPKVIGFESNPKPCGFGEGRYLYYSAGLGGQDELWFFALTRESDKNLAYELRKDLFGQIVCEIRPEGDIWYTVPPDPFAVYDENTVQWNFKTTNIPGSIHFWFSVIDTSGEIYTWPPGVLGLVELSKDHTYPIILRWSNGAYNPTIPAGEFGWPVDKYEIKLTIGTRKYFHCTVKKDYGTFGLELIDMEPEIPTYPSSSGQVLELTVIPDYEFPP